MRWDEYFRKRSILHGYVGWASAHRKHIGINTWWAKAHPTNARFCFLSGVDFNLLQSIRINSNP